MTTPEKYAHRNTPCGRGRAAYVTEILCRSLIAMRQATKCRQLEGLQSIRRENHGRAITRMQMDPRKANRSKVVAKDALSWGVANVAPRPISISSWRNSPVWVPSADCTQGARRQFPICRMPWLNSTVGMGAD